MPKGDTSGIMEGFQLWANLPAKQKMMPPRYRDVKESQIPKVTLENGIELRIICGKLGKTQGPVKDIVTDPEYMDVTVPPKTEYLHPTKPGHTVFVYVIAGSASFCREKKPFTYEVEGVNYFDMQRDPYLDNETLVLFEDGDHVAVSTEGNSVRFLLISGKPLNEPVAWYGPIVMNTQEELRMAFDEYEKGTFIKSSQ